MNPLNQADNTAENAIAIIGMSARFPGAPNLESFWELLRQGRESIRFFNENEIVSNGVDPEIVRKPNYVRARPVLDDIEYFDSAFFQISPREAELMDPQHRLFLECAWEAMENAAHNPLQHRGRIGVFAGAGKNTYLLLNLLSQADWMHSDEIFKLLLGNEKDYLSTRVSYKLNLKGPSVTIQTACSSSLVAVHMACQSLLLGECDMALAGGVSVDVPREAGYLYRPGGILSPDGHCRAYDAEANGVTFGQGVGAVVLRRASDALPAGDFIHALIRGTAVNNDGADRAAFTAPSINGQAQAICEALTVSAISPETVTYVEGHGTATPIGDPIEVEALTRAFRRYTQRTQYCALGSVKTNVGHLGAAAGVAGLIKTILALEHKEIPPSLHFSEPNPQMKFSNSPFFVNSKLRPWSSAGPRRAGVSSFGQGGTNAHVILEEAPQRSTLGKLSPHAEQVLVLSAQTTAALDEASRRLADFLTSTEFELADIAYTLQIGRAHFNFRRIVVCCDKQEAANALRSLAADCVFDGFAPPSARKVESEADQCVVHNGNEYVLMLGKLWLRGVQVDWNAYHADRGARRVPLPTHPFQRRYHWIKRAQRTLVDEQRNGKEALAGTTTDRPQTELTLTRICCDLLGVEAVHPDDDFFELGGDSLVEMQFRERVAESLGINLYQGVLLDHPTVNRLMPLVMKSAAQVQKTNGNTIDLASEVVLDDEISAEGLEPANGFERLFLTGATGLLGSHMLEHLLKETSACIYCLVRAGNVVEAYQRLRDVGRLYALGFIDLEQRVVPVPGDLSAPRFGLAAPRWEELASSIDVIYHCGASVNFIQSYEMLKRINVRGTQEALRLAAKTRLKPLHHVSSIAVFESEGLSAVNHVSEDEDIRHCDDLHNAYDMTKWVGEQIMILARQRGLPVSIYRLSNVSGHSATGIMRPHHIITSLLKGCMQLGLAPEADNIINVIPVDAASRMLVTISLQPDALGKNFHIVNPESTRIGDIVNWLNARGYALQCCRYREWREALRAAPDDNAFKVFLPLVDEAPLFTNRSYDMTNTRRHLSTGALDCPAFDERLLDRYLSYLISRGYLPAAAPQAFSGTAESTVITHVT